MKISVKIIAVSFFILSNFYGYSQKDSIMNKDVEVIKAYQPSISDAYKIVTSPKINDTIKYSPVFEYKIQSTLIPLKKSIQNLPVVQLGNPPKIKSNTGFLKAGFGNALTPYGEFVLNTHPSKLTDFGIQLFHYSSNPNVELTTGIKAKSPYSENRARIFVKNYFGKSVLNWSIQYDRNRFNYYGFPGDSLIYRETENISGTLNKKQVFNNATAKFNLKQSDLHADFDYDITLGYNYFWNATGQKSHHGNYEGTYTIKKQNFEIKLGSMFDYFYQDSIRSLYTQDFNQQFFHAGISPQIIFERKNWILKAGLNLSSLIDNDTSAIFHISPKIYFAYSPIKNILSIFAGTDGNLSTNNYQSMTLKNRYLDFNTVVKPSQELIKLFGGFKGKFSRNISYLFDVGYSIKSNEPFYYLEQTKYPFSDEISNIFSVKYDDMNVLRFGGNIRYSSENVTVALQGNYYSYKTGNNTTLTHLPDYDAGLSTSIQITSKIKGKLDATVIGKRKAEISVTTYTIDTNTGLLINNPVPKSTIYDLNTIIDIGLGADYSFNKRLNFFLDVKNLINQNYEVWHGYNAQGILIMAGARYTF